MRGKARIKLGRFPSKNFRSIRQRHLRQSHCHPPPPLFVVASPKAETGSMTFGCAGTAAEWKKIRPCEKSFAALPLGPRLMCCRPAPHAISIFCCRCRPSGGAGVRTLQRPNPSPRNPATSPGTNRKTLERLVTRIAAGAAIRAAISAPCRHSGIFIPRGREVECPRGMQSRGMKMSGIPLR